MLTLLAACWNASVPVETDQAAPTVASLPAVARGRDAAELFGTAVAGGGDRDGDGVPDVAVGAPGLAAAWPAEGGVHLLAGPVAGGVAPGEPAVLGGGDQSLLGRSGAMVGDLDGDGLVEFAFGAPHYDGGGPESGGVVVVWGDVGAGTPTSRLFGEQAGDHAGIAVAALPPDDDAPAGMVVGAYLAGSGGAGRPGAATVTRGPWTDGADLSAGGVGLAGTCPGAHLGAALAAGDLDGDGLQDVVLGANRDRADCGEGPAEGAVAIFLGPFASDRLDEEADRLLRGEAPGDHAGIAISVPGDLDGDGLPEVGVGAYKATVEAQEGGAAYLFDVTLETGLADAPLRLASARAEAKLGFSLAGVEDLDGDGLPELVVGAPGDGDLQPGAGAIWVFSAREPGRRTTADALFGLEGGASWDMAGMVLAPAGDQDGDGRADLLVGLPLADPGGLASAGELRLLPGGWTP